MPICMNQSLKSGVSIGKRIFLCTCKKTLPGFALKQHRGPHPGLSVKASFKVPFLWSFLCLQCLDVPFLQFSFFILSLVSFVAFKAKLLMFSEINVTFIHVTLVWCVPDQGQTLYCFSTGIMPAVTQA